MRENRLSGSEGGGTCVLPTPMECGKAAGGRCANLLLPPANPLQFFERAFVLFQLLSGFSEFALRGEPLVFLKLLDRPVNQLLDRLRRCWRSYWCR